MRRSGVVISVTDVLVQRVEEIVRAAELEVIRPRFSALAEHEVQSKSPGEIVTVADVEAEKVITDGLRRLLPDTPVVGEEACASDPSLLEALTSDRAWLVDPIDGTGNFVAGGDDWAVMVALVESGQTVASWIWVPMHDAMHMAQLGQGATCNGRVLRTGSAAGNPLQMIGAVDPLKMSGAVLTRFLDSQTAERVEANRHRFANITAGRLCAGVDYPNVIEGGQQFIMYWRTLPWDHAPGALLIQESGGVAARLDGTTYQPSQTGTGLLVATDPQTWKTVRKTLLSRSPDEGSH